LWFILGFLGVIILLKTLYFEVGNVIWVLITIGFSTSLISLHHSQIKFIRSVGLFFYAAIFIVSAGLLYITFVHNPGSYYPYPSTKSWKDVFSKILNICGTYNCEHVAFLSSENVGPFLIQARFDNNVNIISSNTINSLSVTGFMSQHDTYFTANGLFKNNQPTTEKIMEIAKVNLNKIQMSRKPLAITYCNSENARKSPAFGADGKNIALPYAIASLKLIQQNSEWKLIKKTESPNGCLAIYSLVPKA